MIFDTLSVYCQVDGWDSRPYLKKRISNILG
jgi:hypothetical protein